MLVINQSKFEKILEQGGDYALANAYVYVISNEMDAGDQGTSAFATLIPAADEIKSVVEGDLSKNKFLENYKKTLKEDQNEFLLYTIARATNEKKFLPIFVTSDLEFELGFMKVLGKFMKKKYGMKETTVKKYLKALKVVKKETKKVKKNKREKAMTKGLREFVKDTLQIKLEGLEKLEKADQKFAIDRIAMLINQSDNAMEEISKKAITQSINSFGKTKKGAKLIKKHVKDLDMSKKSERWSKREMVNLVLNIYADIHDLEDAE